MVQLIIKVLGITKATHQLNAFAANISDWRGYWDDVEEYLDKRESDLFASEGASHGVTWAPLSPEYAIRKAQAGFGSQSILVRTGSMKSGLLKTGPSSHFAVRQKSRFKFVWGSSDPLVRIHGRGLGKGLPKRSIIVLTPDDVKKLARMARDFINQQAIESGMSAFSLVRRGL